ncbi:MAG: ABC transporter substrate-binding protein [Verrucomicrobiota bacterium]
MDQPINKTDIYPHSSRRKFIRNSALMLGGAGVLGSCKPAVPLAKNKQVAALGDKLPINAAGYQFPRLKALFDGRVNIEGCDAKFEKMGIGDMNTNVFSGPQTLDLTEIGLHPFMLAYGKSKFRDYTLLPIFPLRLFRHKSVFIRTDRGIKEPKDLIGKSIATPGYSSTSLTWIRGIFQDEYGINPNEVQWITAAKDSAADISGKVSEFENFIPEGVSIQQGPVGKDESDLLESGEADALFHAAEPRAYVEGHPKVARLFPDYRKLEQDYFSRTGIFPIMHAVAIRKSLLDQEPWLAEAVFKAYSQAKQLAYEQMTKMGWVSDMLPWYGQELKMTRQLMGDNFYSYGIEGNRKTLEALFRYSYEQGFSDRQLKVEDLFDARGLELTEA